VKTPKSGSLSSLLSLIFGLIATLAIVGFGITAEVPVGIIKGTVVMQENGRPLQGAFVAITKLDANDDDESDDSIRTEHHFRVNKSGAFVLRDVLAGDYKLEVSAKAHNIAKQMIKVAEGQPTVLDLEAKPVDPYLEMYASQRVYLPSETARIQLKGFDKGTSIHSHIYKLDFDKIIKDGGVYNALAPLARPDAKSPVNPASMGQLVSKNDMQLADRDAEGTFRDKMQLPPLAEGLYWVQCQLGTLTKGTWISVSKIGLIIKHSSKDLAGYVTMLDSGQPVPGATVGFASASGMLASGTSSADGLVRLSLPKKSASTAEVVVASFGASKAMVDFHRADEGDDAGDDETTGDSEVKIYSYTDRPIYRPGDLVQFKGIVRVLKGSKYVLPKKQSVSIQVQDGQGNVINNQTLALNAMGSYHGQYQFSPDSLPDDYSLVTHYGSASDTKDVGVAAYRKPTFSIDVKAEKPSYIRGESAKVVVATKYYYGAPVVGATVTATVTRSPYWDWSDYADSEEDYSDEYGEDESPDQSYGGQQLDTYSGEQTQQLTAVTDENGKATFNVPTIGANEPAEASNDFTYDVNVDVKDQSDKDYNGDGTFTVMRSDEKVKLTSDLEISTAGKAFTVTGMATSMGKQPLANLSVDISSGYLEWTKKGDEIVTEQQNQTITTGPDGKFTLQYNPPGSGFYQVSASFKDERGHLVSRKIQVYIFNDVSLQEEADRFPSSNMSILLDKKQYRAGDTVRALITCDDPGGTAMLSIEGAMIYQVQTLKLAKKATMFEFKVVNDYSPNAFLSLAYIHNKKYADANRQVLIDLGIKKLSVNLTQDKPAYHPGDTAHYTVTTKDADGKPVPAEVSLGVVDEPIYAIFDDHSDIVKGFYPKRSDDIQTDYSFPEMYLGGGDKAPTNIQVRSNFKDTAFWQPDVSTDASGQAKVSVKLPDNITSWRATARAVTSDTEVGQTMDNVLARKDLMVQLSAPAFVVNGDQQRMVAMITNNTGQAADVKLQLAANNASVEGDLNQTVHIENGALQTVEYKMTPAHSGEADFVAKAWVPGGASDGMELKVPVTPHARLKTDGYGGDTNTTQTLPLTLDPNADKYSGGLAISVTPTVATSLLGSLDAFIQYPYGCVEQTTSRFLPTVIFAKTFKDLGLPRPKLESQVPQIVQDSYSRLQQMQHTDGGWGWWDYDASDPYMTAYVLEAIHRATIAGFPPPKSIDVAKAITWAEAFAQKPKLPAGFIKPTAQDYQKLATDTDYLIYALALNGRPSATTLLDKADIGKADAAQCAFLALAANTIGASETAKRDQLISRMLSLGHETRSTMEWAPEDYWGYETTGRCFMALETVQPDSPTIPKIVNLLMQKRTGDMWFSTRDTSAILLVMADYLRHTKELLSNADIVVSLNGKSIKELQFQQGSFDDEATQIKLPISALTTGQNNLQFQAKSGTCYYTTTLKQYVVSADLVALTPTSGFSITRTYHKLQAQKMEDGTLKLLPSKDPVSEYNSGDVLRCEIKIHSDVPRSYLFIEDPTPSGLHVTDKERPDDGEQWVFWWSRTVILDDRVCFFARDLPSGDQEIDYVLQAENPGKCDALPVTTYNMYDPSEMASGSGLALQVNP
jgi:hypothetical protein